MNNHIDQKSSNHTPELYRKKAFKLSANTFKPEINNYRQQERENQTFENVPENIIFNKKNKRLFSKILPYLETVTLAKHNSIYQPGEKIDYVYFPQSAIFSEFQILEDGSTVEIAMTGSEGIIGLNSVFDQNTANNWTQVSVGGKALRLKSQLLREEAGFNYELRQILYGCVGSYIKQISQRSVCNNFHLLEKRLCSWLLMMQDRFKNTILPLTQEHMARLLGVNRPSLSNLAYDLRVAEIIDYRRGSLMILNRAKLENRACGCFAEIDKNIEGIF